MGVNIDLKNKTVLITGATRGIGAAIAHVFVQANADVVLTGTKKDEIARLNEENGNSRIKWVYADFSTRDSIDAFINELQSLQGIDICINNAGINIIKPFDEYTHNDYNRLININLTAPFMLSQFLVKGMASRGFGRIINIASIWSQISKPDRTLYSTSKTGLVGTARTLAVEYAASNILVNSVSPGFTLTELTRQSLSEEEMTDLGKQIPMQRFAETSEIAKVVLFLASDLNTYITGQNIIVDGGFTLV